MRADEFLAELEQEARATRRVLERVPADRLAWRPSPKAMALGQPAMPTSVEELLPAFDAALEDAAAPWRLSSNGQEVFTIPRAALIRSLMLNHWYHHRGQLVVLPRVPLPEVKYVSRRSGVARIPAAR